MSTALAVCHGVFGRVTVYRLDRPMRTHAHREGHLIFYLGGAPAILSISGVLHRIDQTGGVAINPWQPHSFGPWSADQPSIFLVAYIRDRWLDRDRRGGCLQFHSNSVRFEATIRSMAFGLADAIVGGAKYQLVDRKLNALFDASLDESWKDGRRTRLVVQPQAPADFRIRKSLRILDDRLAQGIELGAVARDAGLSRPHFFKLFRENTGVTPVLYANTIRVERALDRLMGSPASVTDIGYELGFSSLSHFTHFFSAHVGISPTMYRTVARVVSE
jgi:AraC-like DNA-binding protein